MTTQDKFSVDRELDIQAVAAVLLGVVVVTLDVSLTSTAVPAIAKGLGVAAASTIWIINGYYLAVVAALLPLAALGEILGHRRVFLAGLSVFVLGSLASALTSSLTTLVLGRALVGLGAAAVSATTPALIKSMYPPARLSRGLGLYAMIVGLAFSVGPTVASSILAIANWPWLFFATAVMALCAGAMGMRGLPATSRAARKFDTWSAALCSAMFACLLFAIASTAHLGLKQVVVAFVSFMLFGLLLRHREARHAAPILAFDLFRRPLFALSAATSICAFAIQGLVFVVLPFLFQLRYGYSQVESGFLITPWPVTLALMTLVAAPLSDRVAPGVLGCVGLSCLAGGLVLIATMPAAPNALAIAWRLVICGIGFGLFQSPNMVALMNSAPKERSGSAGGILATSRLLGQSLGAAAVAYCLSVSPMSGLTYALWLGAGLGLLGGAISILRLAPAVRRT
ncbi:MFS transporter [Achromobacter spanius]|uniref:MFS transporter n=1 Tax=Achromobacter spanius TaxID=217203 RepID=UPI0037FBFDB4